MTARELDADAWRDDDSDLRATVAELQAAIATQRGRLEAQEAEIAALRLHAEADAARFRMADADAVPHASDRRGFFRIAGAAVVGAAAASMLTPPGRASAADGAVVFIGDLNTTSPGSPAATTLDYSGAAPRRSNGANAIFAVTEGGIVNAAPAAISGFAGDTARDGIAGSARVADGSGVLGFGLDGVGVAGLSSTGLGVIGFSPNNADVVALGSGVIGLVSHLPAGPPAVGSYVTGDLLRDDGGNLFACVQGGSPGLFRRLAGPTTAGALTAISPQRVYDSRGGPKITTNVERTISVAAATSGGVVVPPGATAVAITLTVTETEDVGGFLSVRPAGSAYAGTSSINWFGPNQNIATTVISALDGSRQLTIRGFNPTHFLVDVTGYFA